MADDRSLYNSNFEFWIPYLDGHAGNISSLCAKGSLQYYDFVHYKLVRGQ